MKSIEENDMGKTMIKKQKYIPMVFDEPECLAYNPFEGDFGEPGDRTLKDKIVTARKPGPCHICGSEIKPGERVRSRVDVCGGELMSFRWCQECCVAMASSWDDHGRGIEKRYSLRRTADDMV